MARSSGCNIFDPGLFKPPYVECPEHLIYGNFLETFMPQFISKIGTPLFFAQMVILFRFYIVFPLIFLVSALISLFLTGANKNLKENNKFPVLGRLILSCIKKLFK